MKSPVESSILETKVDGRSFLFFFLSEGHLAREAVELVDAGHREVGISWNTPQWKLAEY
jgi:arginyl-tRNA synthetase